MPPKTPFDCGPPRHARAERKDNLALRTMLEDPFGAVDPFVQVIQTSLDEGWWLIYVSSYEEGSSVNPAFNAAPIEIIAAWTAGGGGGVGTQLIATINNSDVFAVYATNLVVTARNTSFTDRAGCNIACCPVLNHVPSELFYDEPFEADANQIVLVPRFATRFKLEIDDPALIGTVYIDVISGANASGPVVRLLLAAQPDNGWWIGNARFLFVVFPAATCRYRVVFQLEV